MRYKGKNLKPKTKRKGSKKGFIIFGVILALCAVGCGVWYYMGHNSSEPTYVYPFQYIGMTEYWGDSQESSGPVTTDKIQTVFLSETQTVTEICVKEGDSVKKGDLLMTFDTTLSDLTLERKRLEVEKLKLQLEEAEEFLKELNMEEPVEPPQIGDIGGPDTNPGRPIDLAGYEISDDVQYDGSAPEKALICWINGEKYTGWSLFEELRIAAEEYQEKNAAAKPPSSASAMLTDEEGEGDVSAKDGVADTAGKVDNGIDNTSGSNEPGDGDDGSTDDKDNENTDTGDGGGTEDPKPPVTDPPDLTIGEYYVVFKVTQGNTAWGAVTLRQGLHVKVHDRLGYSFQFFDASAVPDHFPKPPEEDEIPGLPDISVGYTKAELAKMRSEQQKKIKELAFNIKMAEAEYKIMQKEISDGNIYSAIDGSVVSVLTEEEAKNEKQPVIKVSGGGGFYVEGAVNELDKDRLKIGQEVTVSDWRSGGTYTGTVKSIGDFPRNGDHWMGMGNPNASYYPFMVFVDESADLQEDSYVSVTYSAGVSQNGIYLENPFIRTEKGRSYCLVLGEDGRLEQRFVTTGKSLWGSYTEIRSGITAEDLIAFPYGKNIKAGIPAQEGDLGNLYG